MDSALPFNLDITNPDGNSFVTWILVTNDGRTQLDARPHGDALVFSLATKDPSRNQTLVMQIEPNETKCNL